MYEQLNDAYILYKIKNNQSVEWKEAAEFLGVSSNYLLDRFNNLYNRNLLEQNKVEGEIELKITEIGKEFLEKHYDELMEHIDALKEIREVKN